MVIDSISAPSIDSILSLLPGWRKNQRFGPFWWKEQRYTASTWRSHPWPQTACWGTQAWWNPGIAEASDQGCGKSCQNKKAGPHDWYCLVLTQKGNYKISWVMGTLHINHCITFKCFEFKASLHITTDMIVARPSKNPATRKPTNVRRTLERKFLCDTLSSAIRPSISPPKNLVPNMPTVSCRQGKSPRPWLREPGPFSLR